MKINYEYTRDDLKKFILKSRLKNNIILFVIGLAIYLWLSINKINLIYLPLVIIGFIILIYLLNKLYIFAYMKVTDMLNYNICGKYILELTPNKFSLTVNRTKTDYKYKSIKKIVEKKDMFIVKLNNRESLTFEKKLFNETDYNKILTMFKEKSN